MKSEQKGSHWCLKVPKEGVMELGLKPVCPPVSGTSGRLISWSQLSTVRLFMLLESSGFLPACLPLAYVCVRIHMCIHVCEGQKLTLGAEFFISTYPPYFWDGVSGTHQFGYTGWPTSPGDLPVSTSGSLCGFWELNTGPHACTVSPLPTESSAPRVLGLFSSWQPTSV